MTIRDDIERDPPYGTYELWRALLAIYNHFRFARELCMREEDALPSEVLAAVRLLDCWLDIAIHEGWTEKVE